MECPKCQQPNTMVIDSRPGKYGLRRRRRCPSCGHRWTTYEVEESRISELATKRTRRECLRIVKEAFEKIKAIQTTED